MNRRLSMIVLIAATMALLTNATEKEQVAQAATPTKVDKDSAMEQYEFVYGFFRKDCYERSDFFTYENRCLQHFSTKILGYCVIIACLVFKVPQMAKIHSTGSVEGLSSFGAVTELLAYMQTMTYARHLGLDFSVYGETILLTIQSGIVLLLIFFYETKIGQ